MDRRQAIRHAKARTVVWGALVGFVVPLCFLAERLVAEPKLGAHHVTVGIAALAAASTPFIVRYFGRHEPAAVSLIAIVSGAVAADAWVYGGLGAASFVAIMILPLMATLFLGLKAGWWTTCAQVLVVLAFLILEQSGVALPEPPERERAATMHAAATCGVLVFIYLLTSIFERERASAETELRTSERRHALAFDVANDGFLEWAPNGSAYCSPPLLAFIAREDEELDVAAFLSLVDGGGAERLGDVVARVRRDGSSRSLDLRLQHRSGEHRIAECCVALSSDRQQPVGTVLCTFRDVHEERRVERVKSEFVSVVSHELRTPLTSIRGALGLLTASKASSPAKTAELLALATRNCHRLGSLVDDLLDFQKLEDGMVELAFEELALDEVALNAVEAIGPLALEKGVRVESSDQRCLVDGDASRLSQVVTNFLSNAIKFSPENGSVAVRVTEVDSRARLSVHDRGPGIPADFQPHVFERFAQADQSDTSGITGTGLGLAICRAIIEQHGGSIGFDTKEGEGTAFWFELPARPADAPA